MSLSADPLARIVRWIHEADGLIVAAGAGMGVDSGLPDFRGSAGFWRAYPALGRAGLQFEEIANPAAFARDPPLAWGFYGHRLALYRRTVPHRGFALLREIAAGLPGGAFVFTSNVDGQFQKAGFAEARIMEVHGSIHHLQCLHPCTQNIWPNRETIPVDEETMRAQYLPRCPHCGDLARPNILMFGDFGWIGDRSRHQERRFQDFLSQHEGEPGVVIEMGAGSAIPTIRYLSERLGRSRQVRVIRINPREPQIAPPHISLATGARSGLEAIEAALAGL